MFLPFIFHCIVLKSGSATFHETFFAQCSFGDIHTCVVYESVHSYVHIIYLLVSLTTIFIYLIAYLLSHLLFMQSSQFGLQHKCELNEWIRRVCLASKLVLVYAITRRWRLEYGFVRRFSEALLALIRFLSWLLTIF